jgi:hypothetical protein
MTFKEQGFELVKNAISKETAHLAAFEFDMLRKIICISNNYPIDYKPNLDTMLDNCFGWYSPLCFESLSLLVQPKVEKVVGKKLWPSYSYGRIYYNSAVLPRHIDRDSSEYAVSVCIKKDSVPWHIGFKSYNGEEKIFDLSDGDMCVYAGNKIEHWREPFEGSEHIQAFLFYVAQDSKYSILKYDTRPYLGMSTDTRKIHDRKIDI